MAEWMSLAEAIAAHVRDGDTVAMEGFTHLIPFAAGHEIIRQGRRRDLSLVRMTPDIIYDQLIGAGCAAKLTFSWGGNPGVGSLHRFRDAVENCWPAPLEIEERSHSDLANAYVAGAANLPFAVLRGYTGSDLARVNDNIRSVTCPFTGEVLAATPAVRPDVTVIHAQKADWKGNVLLWGILGVQKEAVLAARRAIVTVEERVRSLDAPPNACILPSWVVTCGVRGATWRDAFVRARLLRARQRLLPSLGSDFARSGPLRSVGRATHSRRRQNFADYLQAAERSRVSRRCF